MYAHLSLSLHTPRSLKQTVIAWQHAAASSHLSSYPATMAGVTKDSTSKRPSMVSCCPLCVGLSLLRTPLPLCFSPPASNCRPSLARTLQRLDTASLCSSPVFVFCCRAAQMGSAIGAGNRREGILIMRHPQDLVLHMVVRCLPVRNKRLATDKC